MFEIYENDFLIENKKEYLISAEIHYFRIEKTVWKNVVEKAIELGCNSVAFYIPWLVHEYKEGEFDFTGYTKENTNLVEFMKLLVQFNLKIILRPGPYIYSEMTNLGLPNWLIENYGQHTIRNYNNDKLQKSEFNFAFGHNNPVFRDKTKKYFEKVIEVCKPFEKNVIMIQLCNEIPGLDVDDNSSYRLEYLQRYIEEEFTLEKFNRVFKKNYDVVGKIEFSNIVNNPNYKNLHLEEQYTTYYTEYFEYLKNIYVQNGMDKLFIHNAYNPKAISLFPKIKEKMTGLFIGTDNYYSLFGGLNDKSLAYFCEYGASYLKSIMKNPPFVIEHESGFWYDTPKVFKEELKLFTFWSLLYGYKGLNMYLFHEGVNDNGMGFNGKYHKWQSLVDLDGNKTEKFDSVKEAILEANNPSVKSDVTYDCAMSFEHFPGLIWDKLSRYTEEFYYFLFKGNHQPEIINILDTPIEKLKEYKCIYFLVDGKLSSELQNKLIELIKLNINIVIVGNLPTNTWYEKDTTLIDYLDIKVTKQIKDGFSQKLLLNDNEIVYTYKNLDILDTNFETIGVTNYNTKVLLKKNNLIILNGFIEYLMKDQMDILKWIDECYKIKHFNYNCDFRVVNKVDGSVFVLNPHPFKMGCNVYLKDRMQNIEIDGFGYKYFES
ncbi:MAG: beta-galactosidase [Lachnospirales bacterium]